MTVKRAILSIISGVLIGLLGVASLGANSVSVLDIAPGVRAIGMGGAGVARVDGAETLYNNPAGLAALPGIGIGSFYTTQPGLLIYGAVDLTLPNWGLGVFTLNSGDIQGYDDSGNPTSTPLSYANTAVMLGFGMSSKGIPFLSRLPLDFSLGGRFKYLAVTDGDATGSGFAVDLAYRMSLPNLRIGPIPLRETALGVSMTNLFGSVNYPEHSDPFGMGIRIGGATSVSNLATLALDLDLSGTVHFGVEYRPVRSFAVRGGVFNRKGGVALTLGLGIEVQGFILDYAYVTGSNLPGSHRVSLSIDFSGIDLSAFGRTFRRILP